MFGDGGFDVDVGRRDDKKNEEQEVDTKARHQPSSPGGCMCGDFLGLQLWSGWRKQKQPTQGTGQGMELSQ